MPEHPDSAQSLWETIRGTRWDATDLDEPLPLRNVAHRLYALAGPQAELDLRAKLVEAMDRQAFLLSRNILYVLWSLGKDDLQDRLDHSTLATAELVAARVGNPDYLRMSATLLFLVWYARFDRREFHFLTGAQHRIAAALSASCFEGAFEILRPEYAQSLLAHAAWHEKVLDGKTELSSANVADCTNAVRTSIKTGELSRFGYTEEHLPYLVRNITLSLIDFHVEPHSLVERLLGRRKATTGFPAWSPARPAVSVQLEWQIEFGEPTVATLFRISTRTPGTVLDKEGNP